MNHEKQTVPGLIAIGAMVLSSACSTIRRDTVTSSDHDELTSALIAADNALAVHEYTNHQSSGWFSTRAFLPRNGEDNARSAISSFQDGARYVHWVTHRQHQKNWRELEILNLISLPVVTLAEGARSLVVEDADSLFFPTNFDAFVEFEQRDLDAPTIQPDDEFEIRLRSVAVDNFTEGRLRDCWGGNGGELSLQVALHALSDSGELLEQDAKFLVSETKKQRSVVLAALSSTEEGRRLVARASELARTAQQYLATTVGIIAKVKAALEQWSKTDDLTLDRAIAELRGELEQGLDSSGLAPEEREAVKQLVAVALDIVKSRLQAFVTAHGGTLIEPILKAVDEDVLKVDHALGVLTAFGVDEVGLFRQVEVIKGLAAADRLATFEWQGVRPKAFQDFWSLNLAADSVVTADRLYDAREQRQPGVARDDGLIFRGRLSELSRIGDAGGFSLSVLMLERDSDQLAQAIRLVESYTKERNLTVSVAGSNVQLSAIADALATLAERIAQDDVELKLLDLRFAATTPVSGSTPGKELLELRPCKIVVARNFFGAADFGAAAILEITKVGRAAP